MIFRDRMTTAIFLQNFQSSDLGEEGSEEKQDALKEKAILVKGSGTTFCKEISHAVCISSISLMGLENGR